MEQNIEVYVIEVNEMKNLELSERIHLTLSEFLNIVSRPKTRVITNKNMKILFYDEGSDILNMYLIKSDQFHKLKQYASKHLYN